MRVKIIPFGMNNYLVSDDGRVFNGFTGKELRQTIVSRTGYPKVVLYGGNGEKKYENIHNDKSRMHIPIHLSSGSYA